MSVAIVMSSQTNYYLILLIFRYVHVLHHYGSFDDLEDKNLDYLYWHCDSFIGFGC